MNNKKIFISGTSGIGKTTLARYIEKEYGIPFINGSTKELWPQFGIGTHRELINKTAKDTFFGLEFQYAVLQLRKEKTRGLERFVTDRGPLDNLVYFTTQLAHKVTEDEFRTYIDACIDNLPKTHFDQINLRIDPKNFTTKQLENDGYRVDSYFYQTYIDGVFRNMLDVDWLGLRKNHNCKIVNIEEWDWSYRTEVVYLLLKDKYPYKR